MPASSGPRVKSWREESGLTQRELADALGYRQSYVGNIEAGRSEPSRNFLTKLQEKFGVRADFILYGDGAPQLPDDPLLLMFCGSAVSEEYAALGLHLTRGTHVEEAIWMLHQVQAQMSDPADGDEFESVLPGVRALLRSRLLKERA